MHCNIVKNTHQWADSPSASLRSSIFGWLTPASEPKIEERRLPSEALAKEGRPRDHVSRASAYANKACLWRMALLYRERVPPEVKAILAELRPLSSP